MSVYACPKCSQRRITWSMDDMDSPWTQWCCGHCGYSMLEDESRVGDCPRCDASGGLLLVKDHERVHRWCLLCGAFESTSEIFDDTSDRSA